jgi:hypothetical protein
VHAISLSAASGAYASGGGDGGGGGGGEVYFNGNATGSFVLTDALSDTGSGPASVSFPAIAASGWTHAAETVATPAGGPYASSTFSWTAGAGAPTAYTVTGADAAGNTATTSLTFASDTSAPTGGALKVNGTQANRGGHKSSTTTSTSFTIDTRTDYAESASSTASGLQSSTLTVQSETLTGSTCGAAGSGGPFATPVQIAGTTQPSGIVGGYCYLYTLTGTDHVGNSVSIKATVKVAIAIASLTLSNGGATAGEPDQGDTVVIAFNGPVSVASLCSAWSGDTLDHNLTDATTTLVDGYSTNDDSLTFTSPTCALHVGAIDLGSPLFAPTGSVTYGASGTGSTVAYSASSDTLTIRLGTQQANTSPATIPSSTATLTPASGLLGVDGNHPATFVTPAGLLF